METRNRIESEALLREVGWVRALARRLVRDEHAAEDLAQDAMVVGVVALRGTQEPRALRQWLGGVVRNLGRNARRRDEARGRREGPLPEDPVLPSTLELVERAATQRELVGVLLELDELDREVLLLHHFEGASNEAIAQRQGVPASTVASRLARAHQRLRTKWIARHGGDRTTALGALVALAGRAPEFLVRAEPMSAAPAVAVGRGGFLAASVLATGAVLGGLLWQQEDGGRRASLASGLATAGPSEPAAIVAAGEPATAERIAAFVRGDMPAKAAAGSGAPGLLGEACPSPLAQRIATPGIALDLSGAPVPGLEFCRMQPLMEAPPGSPSVYNGYAGVPTTPTVTSDEDGRFSLDVARVGWFETVTEGWTTVLATELNWMNYEPATEAVTIVAPTRSLEGHVIDRAGHAIEGVSVHLQVAESALTGLEGRLEKVAPLQRRASTGPAGAFAFAVTARVSLRLELAKDGFETLVVTLAPDESAGELVLEPTRLPTVTGTVRDLAGTPLEGVQVSLGHLIARSGADGRYLVSWNPEQAFETTGDRLVATLPGVGSTERVVEWPAETASGPLEIDLVLDRPTLAFTGRVVDTLGEPVSGLEVYVLEETPFGWERRGNGYFSITLEDASGSYAATTGPDGRFRIPGLAERAYRVQALEPQRLQSAVVGPVHPGSGEVTLVFDHDARGAVAGRMVDLEGLPIAGARVAVSTREWWSGEEDTRTGLAIGASTTTDDDGWFRLEDVAASGVFLRLEGDPIVPDLFREIDGAPDRAHLELRVSRRSGLQVTRAPGGPEADSLHLEGLDGRRLAFAVLRLSSISPRDSLSLGARPVPAVVVPSETAFVVLTLGDQEVLRERVHLVAGETLELEL